MLVTVTVISCMLETQVLIQTALATAAATAAAVTEVGSY